MGNQIPGYQIRSLLGKGGMANVYLAIQESLDRQVALKVMSPILLSDPTFASRFQLEARTAASLNHPNVIAIYDVGHHQKYHYISMELVSGGTLKERVEAGMSPADAISVLRQIAGALDYAGEQGIIHRDIKPENIMFRDNGSVVLGDFGIARAAHQQEQLTEIGKVVGTPAYMSPEQHQGHSVGLTSDIYSLGVVFFEMLTGKVPFQGRESIAVGMKHVKDPVPRLARGLVDYQPVIDRMLAKQPSERFARAADLLSALDDVLAPGPKKNTARKKAPRIAPAGAPADQQTGTDTGIPSLQVSEEVKLPRQWLKRRYGWRVRFEAMDMDAFQPAFSGFTADLLAWHRQRGKQCAEVSIEGIIHPWIAGRVREFLRNLRQGNSHAFLRALTVFVELRDTNGEQVDQIVMEPDTD